MPNRSRVRVESNERIDKPDFEALQLGAHLAVRYLARGLLFGTDATDTTVVTSAWSLVGAGTELTVTPGRAVAGEIMADNSVEQGHIVGEDGDASQTLDFVGQPADTYYVYVRPDFSPGVSGSRIFYNAATDAEDAAAIDTREVSGWKVVAATSSPGTGYTQVGAAVWNGAAFTSVSAAGLHFWEGMLTSAGVESSNQWGDGVNDRNANRALYGVQSLFKAAALVRRQLKDIIGAASGHWGSAVPTSLTAAKTHIDTVTDPHGAAPTWTGKPTFNGGIDVNGQVDARGAGYVSVDDRTDIRFTNDQDGTFWVSGLAMQGFITNGVSSTSLDFVDGGNGRLNNDGTGTMGLLIPLDIPVGATLTSVSFVAEWENTTGSSATVHLYVYKQVFALFAVALELLGDQTENDASLVGAAPELVDVNVGGLSDVKDTLRGYFAYVTLANAGTAGKLSAVYLCANYTFNRVVG